MTPLDKSLKRVLKINGRDFVVTLTPDALKITEKGHRLGLELKWADLVSGESALAVALRASVGQFQKDVQPSIPPPKPAARRKAPTAAASRARPAAPRRSR